MVQMIFSVSLVWWPGQNKRIAPLSFSSMDVVKGDLRINSIPPETDCNQTAIGVPPDTSAVFLIAKSFW
jgi:hypothetical protein